MSKVGFGLRHVLREHRKRLKLTQDEAAEKAGITGETVSRIERGIVEPSPETLRALAPVYRVPAQELLALLVPASEADVMDADTYDGYQKDAIPVVSEAEASSEGTVFWTDDGVHPDVIEDRTSRPYNLPYKVAYAVRVRGDSMVPVFKPGMELIVTPNASVRDGDEVFVALRSGERLVKYATRAEGGWMLTSANPAHPPRYVRADDVEAVHAVVHSKRRR